MSQIIPYVLLGAMLLFLLGFAIFHWRYHPQATAVDSFADLKNRLRAGKPTLLQFHAPL